LAYVEKNQSAGQWGVVVIDALNTITVNTTRRVAETVNLVCISVSITLRVQRTHTANLSRLYHFPYGSKLKTHPAETDITKRGYY